MIYKVVGDVHRYLVHVTRTIMLPKTIVDDYEFHGRDELIYEMRYDRTYISFLPAELRHELLMYRNHSSGNVYDTLNEYYEDEIPPFNCYHLRSLDQHGYFIITSFHLTRYNHDHYEKFLDDVIHRRETEPIIIYYDEPDDRSILTYNCRYNVITTSGYYLADWEFKYIEDCFRLPVTIELLDVLLGVPVNR